MITFALILITGIVSYFGFNDFNLFDKLCYSPRRVIHFKEYWRTYTYALLHGDWMHLIFNMFTLYSFGSILESYGVGSYLLLIGLTTPLSLVYNLYTKRKSYSYTAVGASGYVSALLFAFIWLNPTSTLLFFIIPMPAWLFGIVFIGASYYMMKKGMMGDVGHDVHIAGAIAGLLSAMVIY